MEEKKVLKDTELEKVIGGADVKIEDIKEKSSDEFLPGIANPKNG